MVAVQLSIIMDSYGMLNARLKTCLIDKFDIHYIYICVCFVGYYVSSCSFSYANTSYCPSVCTHTVAHQEAHMPRSYQIHPKKGHLYMKKSAAKPWV